MTSAGARGPFIILDPAIIIDRLGPNPVPGLGMVRGAVTAAPQLNGSVDRLNEICREVGAGVVLSSGRRLGNALDRLARLGLRAHVPVTPLTDEDMPDRSAIIAEWLEISGHPRAVVIESTPPPADWPGTRITVRMGAVITGAHAKTAINALALA